MNLYDFSNINRIFDRYQSQIPGIKIVDGSKSLNAVVEFKNDLESYNSHGKVEKVLIHEGCLVDILLSDSKTPVVYYFTDKFDGVGDTICEFKNVCEDLNIEVFELN